METLGRFLMIGGIVLLIIGGLVFLSARLSLPLGHLPGDIRIERPNFRLYLPLTSGLLVSLVVTLILNIVVRFLKK
jgi:hypothetical protein